MAINVSSAGLTIKQRKAVREYVDELMNEKLRILTTYLDVDRDLELRPVVKKRLSRSRRKEGRISHDRFWSSQQDI